jgi:hypothetical protein
MKVQFAKGVFSLSKRKPKEEPLTAGQKQRLAALLQSMSAKPTAKPATKVATAKPKLAATTNPVRRLVAAKDAAYLACTMIRRA